MQEECGCVIANREDEREYDDLAHARMRSVHSKRITDYALNLEDKDAELLRKQLLSAIKADTAIIPAFNMSHRWTDLFARYPEGKKMVRKMILESAKASGHEEVVESVEALNAYFDNPDEKWPVY